MTIFRLTPIDPSHPNWNASTHKAECVLRADSEDGARNLAHSRFAYAVTKSRGQNVPVSPWKNDELVRAEIMEESGHPEDGPHQILVPMGYSWPRQLQLR